MASLPIDHSRRSRTTQTEILQGFISRLLEMEGTSEQNTVVSDQAIPKDPNPGGKFLLAVSAENGRFEISSSAHHACATERIDVVVGIFLNNLKDRIGRSESKILNPDSISDWKRRVLSKLMVDDPSLRTSSPSWEPCRIVGNVRIPLLREPPVPKVSQGPFDAWKNWTGIKLVFDVLFDWELYENAK